jgi:MHS family proline/betaine transporter-like MFS transporter
MSQMTSTGNQRATRADFRPLFAAVSGNFAEWYEFGVYGVVATVIAGQFFSKSDPQVALLQTYAIFALSFIARPVGSLVLGRLGDIWGRRNILMITVAITSFATGVIGLLPTYASIGVAAPAALLVCRLLQGLAAGGEYGSAVTYVYEHRSTRRGTHVSYMVAGTFLGVLVGTLLSGIVSSLMSKEDFAVWGWRLLFLLSFVFGAISLYARRRIADTPEFEALERERRTSHIKPTPLTDAFIKHWRRMLLLFLITATYAIATYNLSTLYVSYLISVVHYSRTEAYTFGSIGQIWLVVFVILLGPVVDRFGPRRMLTVGFIWVCALAVPTFYLANLGPAGAVAAGLIMATGKGLLAVAVAFSMSYLFPPDTRVTAGSISYNAAQVTFGGTAPLVALWLIGLTGNNLSFGYVQAGIAFVSLVALLIAYPRSEEESL